MRKKLLPADGPLTFADYFRLNLLVQDVLSELGYDFETTRMQHPLSDIDPLRTERLRTTFEESMPCLTLTSEIARREFLIAPMLLEVVHYTSSQVRSEYSIDAGLQLKGSLDYLILGRQQMLVVEAKNEDLTRGFMQLAVELVALEKVFDQGGDVLYGAVSTGTSWQFGTLNRATKLVTQDLQTHRVPDDMDVVLKTLVGVLTSSSE